MLRAREGLLRGTLQTGVTPAKPLHFSYRARLVQRFGAGLDNPKNRLDVRNASQETPPPRCLQTRARGFAACRPAAPSRSVLDTRPRLAALSGADGHNLASLRDEDLMAPSRAAPRIQEAHLIACPRSAISWNTASSRLRNSCHHRPPPTASDTAMRRSAIESVRLSVLSVVRIDSLKPDNFPQLQPAAAKTRFLPPTRRVGSGWRRRVPPTRR